MPKNKLKNELLARLVPSEGNGRFLYYYSESAIYGAIFILAPFCSADPICHFEAGQYARQLEKLEFVPVTQEQYARLRANLCSDQRYHFDATLGRSSYAQIAK